MTLRSRCFGTEPIAICVRLISASGFIIFSKAASVTLVARDHRDLGDEADASSGRPDASAAADDSATSTSRKRDQAEGSRSAAEEQANQPPSRVCRALISANTEPFTGDCPVCMVEYVSGQITCTTCRYEPLPVDESGEGSAQQKIPIARKKVAMKKLNEFGIYGDVNSSLLQAIAGRPLSASHAIDAKEL